MESFKASGMCLAPAHAHLPPSPSIPASSRRCSPEWALICSLMLTHTLPDVNHILGAVGSPCCRLWEGVRGAQGCQRGPWGALGLALPFGLGRALLLVPELSLGCGDGMESRSRAAAAEIPRSTAALCSLLGLFRVFPIGDGILLTSPPGAAPSEEQTRCHGFK